MNIPRQQIDGGWGWIIVTACFVNNMLVIGLIKTYGILFIQFLSRFQASASITSLILGIKSAAFSLSAMLALNILLSRVSIRKLSLLGATLTSGGMLLSVFAKNVAFLVFSQSFLTGLGNAFVFGPGVYLLGQYFDTKRPLAIALSNAGVSIGLMVLPPLVTFLFEEYQFQGALLLLSGVMMQTIVCAALFRPIQLQNSKIQRKEGSFHDEGPKTELPENVSIVVDSAGSGDVSGVPDQGDVQLKYHTSIDSGDNTSNENISFVDKRSTSPHPDRKGKDLVSNHCMSRCRNALRFFTSIDLTLFKSPIFIVILGFSFFGFVGNELCGAFIPPLAKEKGLTDMQVAQLLSVAAALDLVSRLLPGIAAQFGLMTRPKMIATAFVIMGVTFQFTAYYNSYSLMIAFIVVYGCFSGFFFSLLPVIIIDFVGLQRFPKAFGFVQVAQGIAGAAAYPLLGTFRDLTGTYGVTFQFLGANMLLASAILLTEPILRKWENRLKNKLDPHD